MATSQRSAWFKVPSTEVKIHWSWTSSLDDFRKARNQINRDLRYMMRDTANRKVVPHVDARAHFVRTITHQGVVARSGTSNSVYITTLKKSGKLKQAVGYIEFGGFNPGEHSKLRLRGDTVNMVNRGRITIGPKRRRSRTNPKHAAAIMTNQGPRRFVHRVRMFRGKGLIQQGVQESEGAFSNALMGEMLTYFEREGFYVNR